MVIYKHGQGFELGTTEKKSCYWPEQGLNPGPPDCRSNMLTTQTCCPCQSSTGLQKLDCTIVRHHSFQNSMLAKHLCQDVNCCIGSSNIKSSDDWVSTVIIHHQKIAFRLNFTVVNGQLHSPSVRSWGTSFGMLALEKCLTHIATLGHPEVYQLYFGYIES